MSSRYEALPDAGYGKCEFCHTEAQRKSVPDINDDTHWALCRNCARWALIWGIKPKNGYVRERNPGAEWHMQMSRAASRDRNMQAATAHSVSAVESRRLGMKNPKKGVLKDYTVLFKEGPIFVTAQNWDAAAKIAREQVERRYPGHTVTPRKVYKTTAEDRAKYPEVFGQYVSKKWVGNPGAAWHYGRAAELSNRKSLVRKGSRAYNEAEDKEYENYHSANKSERLMPNPISAEVKKKFPWLAVGIGALVLIWLARKVTGHPLGIAQSEVDREIIR